MKKGEYGEGRRTPGKGKKGGGGGNSNREKGYKKGIIVFLFTRATPVSQLVYI